MEVKNIFKIIMAVWLLLFVQYSFADNVITDTSITSSVYRSLQSDSTLFGTNITVGTSDGDVSLSGSVDSNMQLKKAIQLTQSLSGVKNVDTSNLRVKGSQEPENDASITAKVKNIFIQQKLFGNQNISSMGIKVETDNGVVSLTGTADDQDQIDNATKLAKSISGVKDVKNSIQLSHSRK